MDKWKCDACGNTVNAESKPPQCPCGSESISKVEYNGVTGKIKKILGF